MCVSWATSVEIDPPKDALELERALLQDSLRGNVIRMHHGLYPFDVLRREEKRNEDRQRLRHQTFAPIGGLVDCVGDFISKA